MQQALLQKEKHPKGKVDSIDRQILDIIQDDSRLSFNRVALKAQVSVGTAYNRIKNLEAEGTIRGYTALVDWVKLGYELTAVIFVQTEGASTLVVEKAIGQSPNVFAVYEVTGEFDAVVIAKFKERDSLNVFIKQLAAAPYVKRTLTNVSLNTVKEDFRL